MLSTMKSRQKFDRTKAKRPAVIESTLRLRKALCTFKAALHIGCGS